MIPRDFIETLLGRLDIVDVIEHYLPLRKAGANYVARCPFHSEKTPSFSVNSQRQFYHCFGCGASGTALGFVMEYTGASFVDAVHELAHQSGLTVPVTTSDLSSRSGASARSASSQSSERPGLGAVLGRAATYFQEQLKHSPLAVEYLKNRGISGAVAGRFMLGYAPAGWHQLDEYFGAELAEELVQTGLVIRSDEGKRYDRFRDRIMFPILDGRSQVIGFGGRILASGEPKYLNSPETTLFEKGRELYGLSQARRAIRDQRTVLVVEGYMDVLALAQFGMEAVVATLGTATTVWHVQKLLRLADQVVFAFDGDTAGLKAARRALEISLPALSDDKVVRFLFLPEQDDPDSCVRREGEAAFRHRLEQALPLSEFLLDTLSGGGPLNQIEPRARFLRQAAAWLPQIQAPALGMMLRQQVCARAQIQPHELDRLLRELRPAGSGEGGPSAGLPPGLRGARSEGVPPASGGAAEAGSERPESRPRAGASHRGARRRFWPQVGRETPSSLSSRLLACLLFRPELVHEAGVPEMALRLPDELALGSVAQFLRHHEASLTLAQILERFREQPEGEFLEEALRREFTALQDSPIEDVRALYQEGLERLECLAQAREVEVLLGKARREALNEEEKQWLRDALAVRAKLESGIIKS